MVWLAVEPGGTFAEAIGAWYDARFPLDVTANIHLYLPLWTDWAFPLGLIGFIVFVYIVIVGSSNAVNLTDGLDGLAILPTVLVGSALGLYAYAAGNPDFAGAAYAAAHPAQVFMGDVGALALGGCLGTMAVVARVELILAVMGGIFVVETLSVMIQTTYFRFSHGKRVFLMAPIHHHFELKGWQETQVVVRFWIITFILTALGLSVLALH